MTITIHNMGEKTAQEVYDYIVAHMRKQGQRSMKPVSDGVGGTASICAYRGVDSNGNPMMCAAGCLIPDEDYTGHLEETDWRGVVNANSNFSNHHMHLILALQCVHDLTTSHIQHMLDDAGISRSKVKDVLPLWEKGFLDVARKHDLQYTAPA